MSYIFSAYNFFWLPKRTRQCGKQSPTDTVGDILSSFTPSGSH